MFFRTVVTAPLLQIVQPIFTLTFKTKPDVLEIFSFGLKSQHLHYPPTNLSSHLFGKMFWNCGNLACSHSTFTTHPLTYLLIYLAKCFGTVVIWPVVRAPSLPTA